jgi:hypothetical protein
MAETPALQTRGQYSPNGAYPQELPDYWKFADGTIRTDLPELSDSELEDLGWFGPIEMPPTPGTSYYTHSYEWNSETLSFDATELEEYEKERRVDYNRFWNSLLESSAYQTIRAYASQSLEVNVYCTEFIALISDAKMRNANKVKIQESINNIFNNIPFDTEELSEVQEIFENSGMSAVYTLA